MTNKCDNKSYGNDNRALECTESNLEQTFVKGKKTGEEFLGTLLLRFPGSNAVST